MTNEEFEAKKQKLLDIEIRAEFGYVDHDNLSVLHEKIKNLQPPKPPTCSTCEHFTGRSCDLGITDRWLEADESFGCLHHSDYGDTE